MASETDKLSEQLGDGYTADDIQVLEGLQGVRKNPAMYIGDTQEGGLHHLIFEVVDNSIDEAMAGYCNEIKVTLHKDGSVSIKDNGRGIPVDLHKDKGIPASEVVLTMLHAGGKFDRKTYKVSGGLHGVGISVVNALAEWLQVEIYKNKKKHYQKFNRGLKESELQITGNTYQKGTLIRFKPDKEIFPETDFKYSVVARRLKELAYLNRELIIELKDEREDKQESFHYTGGIFEYVQELTAKYKPKGDNDKNHPLIPDKPYFFEKQTLENVQIEVALQYCNQEGERVLSYANNINTFEGGTHVAGIRSGLTRAIKQYATTNDLLKGIKFDLTGDDTRDGLICIISIKLPNPQFQSQTKVRLINNDIKGIVESTVNEMFSEYLEQNPASAKLIVEKAKIAARSRVAAKKAKEIERSTPLGGKTILPGKLADCSERNPELCEIYIVEGDSAGGTAKQGRNRDTQAILPIRGKLLNVERVSIERMLSSQEIKGLIAALGCGIGDNQDMERLRYHKVVIMTDADVDGSHIRTLLLTFFFRHMPDIIENGYLFIAQPPLYRVAKGKKDEIYLKDEKTFDRYMLRKAADKVVFLNGRELPHEPHEILPILKDISRFENAVESMERQGHPSQLLKLIAYAGFSTDEFFDDDAQFDKVSAFVADNFTRVFPELVFREVDAGFDEDSDCRTLIVRYSADGVKKASEVSKDTFHHSSVKAFFKIAKVLQELGPIPFKVEIAGDEGVYYNTKDMQQQIFLAARKGHQIQRYKGLGEMNADQLWETTMDPENRTLLKVGVLDSEAANEVFQTLMGDSVQPRREFIEAHALEVKNLDI